MLWILIMAYTLSVIVYTFTLPPIFFFRRKNQNGCCFILQTWRANFGTGLSNRIACISRRNWLFFFLISPDCKRTISFLKKAFNLLTCFSVLVALRIRVRRASVMPCITGPNKIWGSLIPSVMPCISGPNEIWGSLIPRVMSCITGPNEIWGSLISAPKKTEEIETMQLA